MDISITFYHPKWFLNKKFLLNFKQSCKDTLTIVIFLMQKVFGDLNKQPINRRYSVF